MTTMARDLARRAAASAERTDSTAPTLAQQIQAMESQFRLAMPRGAEASQLVRDALTALRTNPQLARCDAVSVLGGLMTCAQLGLRPGVLGHAWLLPFYDSKAGGYKAQLVIGYQGLVDLAHRSGRIASLIARTVHENDDFDVDYGLADTLTHRPNLLGERGRPIAYYAIAKFTTGGHAFIVISHSDMEAYRDRYAMAKTREGRIVGPWRDQFEGMAHKTCVRQLAKWMPKSTELASAIEADGRVRVDLSPTADLAAIAAEPEVIEGEVVDTTTGEIETAQPDAVGTTDGWLGEPDPSDGDA